MAERELSLNLSEGAKDLLVEKGWDPSMGARPLRRAIQRYIEDPLADEVLRAEMASGSTVEIERDPELPKQSEKEGNDSELKITIAAPAKKREAVGVGAAGGEPGELPQGEAPSSDLPDEPDVLPEVPDAPPEAREPDPE